MRGVSPKWWSGLSVYVLLDRCRAEWLLCVCVSLSPQRAALFLATTPFCRAYLVAMCCIALQMLHCGSSAVSKVFCMTMASRQHTTRVVTASE